METINATVENIDDKRFIKLIVSEESIQIPLCEDNPIAVKRAFNSLILKLRSSEIQIALADVGDDLFSQVAAEYIKHLNAELVEVRGEMEQYGLVDTVA